MCNFHLFSSLGQNQHLALNNSVIHSIRTELQKLHLVQKHRGRVRQIHTCTASGMGSWLTPSLHWLEAHSAQHLGTTARLKQHTLASYFASSVNEKYSSPSLHRVFCLTRQTLFTTSRHTFPMQDPWCTMLIEYLAAKYLYASIVQSNLKAPPNKTVVAITLLQVSYMNSQHLTGAIKKWLSVLFHLIPTWLVILLEDIKSTQVAYPSLCKSQ